MSLIAGSSRLTEGFKAGLRGYDSGALWHIATDYSNPLIGGGPNTTIKRILFPPACSATARRPSGENYTSRQYIVGGHTANLIVDEEFRCHRQGVIPPQKPSVAVGGGTTVQICYLRWYDVITGERSSLSEGTTVTGDINRAWTSLPTEVSGEQIVIEGTATFAAGAVTGVVTNFTDLRPGDRIAVATDLTRWAQVRTIAANDDMTIDDTGMAGAGVSLVARPFSRISHVELWVSVSGALPRFIMRVPIGTTSVSENVATLALGEAFIDSYIPMLTGTMNIIYNDRQLVAGVACSRDTVFLSEIGFPERYAGLAFRTKYSEPIVGLLKYRDYVVVLCPESSYRLQGYTEDDYVLTVLEPDIGGFGHHGNIVAGGRAIVPGKKGIHLFNGAFHPAIPSRISEWSERSRNNKVAYEEGFAAVNPDDDTYHFSPDSRFYGPMQDDPLDGPLPIRTSFPLVWIGDYTAITPDASGSMATPEWTNDAHGEPGAGNDYQVLSAMTYVRLSGSSFSGKFLYGYATGKIYEESETTPWPGAAVIATPHYLLGGPGGDRDEANELIRLWTYVMSEDSGWFLRIFPGDEFAYPTFLESGGVTGPWRYEPATSTAPPTSSALMPRFREEIAASALVVITPGGTDFYAYYTPRTVHLHEVSQHPICGRGFTFEFWFSNPAPRTLFMGLGGSWGVGKAGRPVRSGELVE